MEHSNGSPMIPGAVGREILSFPVIAEFQDVVSEAAYVLSDSASAPS